MCLHSSNCRHVKWRTQGGDRVGRLDNQLHPDLYTAVTVSATTLTRINLALESVGHFSAYPCAHGTGSVDATLEMTVRPHSYKFDLLSCH
jgi:hypothetical protein